jgi:hypothetical protein
VAPHTCERSRSRILDAPVVTEAGARGGGTVLSAERRAAEADRVVDLCIGLEALLSDPKGETTYKIAVRGSAFLAHTGVTNASEFYRALKRVYGFRSAIVHAVLTHPKTP